MKDYILYKGSNLYSIYRIYKRCFTKWKIPNGGTADAIR